MSLTALSGLSALYRAPSTGLDFSTLTDAYLRPNGTDGYVRPNLPNNYYKQPGG